MYTVKSAKCVIYVFIYVAYSDSVYAVITGIPVNGAFSVLFLDKRIHGSLILES